MIKLLNIRQYRLVGILLSLALFTVSCDDLLYEEPVSEISAAGFWKTNADANLGVVAIYDGMQATFRQKHYYWGEFRADNFTLGNESANPNNLELVYNDVTSGNTPVLDWGDLYIMINRANLAIKYIPQIPNYDPNLLAEAHALRAYAYFDAIRVWGALPLFTEPIESSAQELQKTRTDAATILNDVIVPDMLKAEELMTLVSDEYRFTKTTVWALQADIYMWMEDFANAKVVLDKIVASNEYSLVTTPQAWQDLFLNDIQAGGPGKVMTGPELMLSIRYDLNEPASNPGQTNANRSGIFSLFFAGLASYYISPTLEYKWREKFPIDSMGWATKYPNTPPVLSIDRNGTGEFEPVYGDWRYYFSRENGINGMDSEEIGEARLAKYNKTNYSQGLDDSDIVLYRYSGMVLLLAEAENRLGNTSTALDLVNEIRTARQLPLVTTAEFGATVEERANYILDERQLELLGEAQRWWDLRRTNLAIPVMNPILTDSLPSGGVPLTEDRLLFPIFDEHLIENPLLEQNAGY